MPIPSGDRPLDRLAAGLLADQLDADPLLGSALGLTEYDDRLPDLSASAVADRERRDDGWLERFTALPDDDLTGAERVDRDLVVMVLRGQALMRDWAEWRRSADLYAGAALEGVFVLLLHRLRPDAEVGCAVAARLRAVPELLDAARANLDPGLAHPLLLERSLGQVRGGAAYARTVAAEIDDAEAQADVAAAGEAAGEAFDRFGVHLSGLVERADGEWAIGEARYDGLLRYAEGLSYGAREMRERGQAAYDEIAADMRRRTRELRGDDDWRVLLDELNADHPKTPEDMRAAYAEVTARARDFAYSHDLVTEPAGEECRVVPSAPFSRAMVAVAHYIPPPVFSGRRAGHFFVPFPPEGASPEQVAQRLSTNSHSSMWTITAHEAYPGHHWHLAHLAANHTRPLRYVLGSTYFTEGWGLYSEELMREQGFFTDPRHELCQRDARLFRAARIVVDTSLHLGEMTVEDAVAHMSTKASLSAETARAEVLRYCAAPTQAASYLTGALEIARMRDAWTAAGRGSLRDFHDRAAGSGRLPVSLVERCLVD